MQEIIEEGRNESLNMQNMPIQAYLGWAHNQMSEIQIHISLLFLSVSVALSVIFAVVDTTFDRRNKNVVFKLTLLRHNSLKEMHPFCFKEDLSVGRRNNMHA